MEAIFILQDVEQPPVQFQPQAFISLPDQIKLSLYSTHKYQIQAQVSQQVYQSFINYLTSGELPNIQIDEYHQYFQLNQEFCLQGITELINSKAAQWDIQLININSLQNSSILDKSPYESEIARQFDEYIDKYPTELMNSPIHSLYDILSRNDLNFSKYDRLYELINRHYEETHDEEIFILLSLIDSSQLTSKNVRDSFKNQEFHSGFAPKNSSNFIFKKFEEIESKYFKMIQMISEKSKKNPKNSDFENGLLKVCGEEDVSDAISLILKKVTLENKLTFELDENNNTANLILSNEAQGDLLIPRCINYESKEYLIKKIDRSLFNNFQITSLEFPEDSEVEEIGYNIQFSNNADIILRYSINRHLFYSSITRVVIPSSVKKLEEGWCCGLLASTTVVISANNPNFSWINNDFIVGKSNENLDNFDTIVYVRRDLEEINIPSYIKIISPYSFCCCTNLSQINIPNESELEYIGKYAFYESGIESVAIPSHVKEICENSFENCSKLQTVEFLPNSELSFIGKFAFANTRITQINILPQLTQISEGTFFHTKLEIITFPENSSLISIDDLAFALSELRQINIPNHVRKLGKKSFYNCLNLENIEFTENSELTCIEERSFALSSIHRITIPSHVVTIEKDVFEDCRRLQIIDFMNDSELLSIGSGILVSSLRTITIPSSIKELSEGWCSQLERSTNIVISANNPNFSWINNDFIVGKSNENLDNFDTIVYVRRDLEEINIPSYIKIISPYSYCCCASISRINIPNESELEYICRYSFYQSRIQCITIPVHVKEIQDNAFLNSWIRHIEFLPNSELQLIGSNAFDNSLIESIRIPPHVRKIGSFAFQRCSHLQTVEFIENSELTSIGKFAFKDSPIQEITIPEHVIKIEQGTFKNCSSLRSVNISEDSDLLSIDKEAFCGTKIESFSISSKVKELKHGWCSGMTRLTSVNIIGNNQYFRLNLDHEGNMFILRKSNEKNNDNDDDDGFDTLVFVYRNATTFTVPSNVKVIDPYCFYCCSQLRRILFPYSNLQVISDFAFQGSSIEEITIPKSVTYIGENAFASCLNLTKVQVSAGSQINLIGMKPFNNHIIKRIDLV